MKNSPKTASTDNNKFDDYFLFSYVCKVFDIKEPGFLSMEKNKKVSLENLRQYGGFEKIGCPNCSKKQGHSTAELAKEIIIVEKGLRGMEEELNDVKTFLRSIVEKLTGLNLALLGASEKKQGLKSEEKIQSQSSKLLHYKLLNESLEKNIKSYQKMRNTLIHNVIGNPIDILKSLNLSEEDKNTLRLQLDEEKIDESDPLFQKIMLTYESFCSGTLNTEPKPSPLKKSDEKKKKKIPSNYPLSPRTKSPVFSPLILKTHGSPSGQPEVSNSIAFNPSTNKVNSHHNVAFFDERKEKAPAVVSDFSDEKTKKQITGSQSTRNSTKKKIEFPDPDKFATESQKKLRTGSPSSIFKGGKFKEV